jgi:DNA-binding response OmpR family regulator
MILITAFGDEETHAEASRLGVAAMFNKPFDVDELLGKVQELATRA